MGNGYVEKIDEQLLSEWILCKDTQIAKKSTTSVEAMNESLNTCISTLTQHKIPLSSNLEFY